MQSEPGQPSLKTSLAYQLRVPFTVIVLAGTWTYVALSPPWFWLSENAIADWFIDGAAWIVFIVGALVRLWATLWISGQKKHSLVNTGPYRVCRNPLYLGTFCMGIGVGLFMKSLVFSVGLLLILLLYLWFVVPAEERYLRSRLGSEYEEYCSRVPRWFPRLSELRRDEFFRSGGGRAGVHAEYARMAWWMLLPILAELTSHYRGSAWWMPHGGGP
jgi:protein-S-isoprenylcysteine O-methyltransferase Ste14